MMPIDSEKDLAEFRRWRSLRNWSIWLFVPGVLLISNVLLRLTHSRYSFLIACAVWMVSTAYIMRPSCVEFKDGLVQIAASR
jgi:hypothetical protein